MQRHAPRCGDEACLMDSLTALNEAQFTRIFRDVVRARPAAVGQPASLFDEALIAEVFRVAREQSHLAEKPLVDAQHIEVDLEIAPQTEVTDMTTSTPEEDAVMRKDSAKSSFVEIVAKYAGRGDNPPAGASVKEASVTFIGVLLTLLIISSLSEVVSAWTDGQYFTLLGNFGATMTLLFDIHKAPAAQPRNLVLGSTVAASVAILVCYIPETLLPVWVRVAVAPALAITAMAKLGISHPPAGAAALIYAQGGAVKELGWMYLVLPLFVGNIISIVMAVVINNLSRDRHYPSYWALAARTW
eukprot:TRINITY_DN23844_c0_g1_i2.p1 TRINITY_DN23844_c0_g1~~TRINITY_DN23844_c0_g1_i2.p1  ORF type:complete len:301 (-),score=46.10 TRINITY_DN23844_c0_g1_i2:381-1283(-)